MKALASSGRTVLVSSHLLSEMAQTADHLLVIGKGKLIADAPTSDFIARTTETTVRARSPQTERLLAFLTERGVSATLEDSAVHVRATPIERVGDLAAEAGVTLHELTTVTGSLGGGVHAADRGLGRVRRSPTVGRDGLEHVGAGRSKGDLSREVAQCGTDQAVLDPFPVLVPSR